MITAIDVEKEILQFIKLNPNCTAKEVIKSLKYSFSVTQKHLKNLSKRNKVKVKVMGTKYLYR